MQGNTAVYLQYAHARICSIIQKANKDIEELKTVSLKFLLRTNKDLSLEQNIKRLLIAVALFVSGFRRRPLPLSTLMSVP